MSTPSEMVVQLKVSELAELVRAQVKAELDARKPSVEPEVLDVDEAATVLKMPVNALRKRARAGEVPGFHIGGLWRFRLVELRQWVLDQQAKSQRAKAG